MSDNIFVWHPDQSAEPGGLAHDVDAEELDVFVWRDGSDPSEAADRSFETADLERRLEAERAMNQRLDEQHRKELDERDERHRTEIETLTTQLAARNDEHATALEHAKAEVEADYLRIQEDVSHQLTVAHAGHIDQMNAQLLDEQRAHALAVDELQLELAEEKETHASELAALQTRCTELDQEVQQARIELQGVRSTIADFETERENIDAQLAMAADEHRIKVTELRQRRATAIGHGDESEPAESQPASPK